VLRASWLPVFGFLALVTPFLVRTAHAESVCKGTMSGSPLRPIARPIVVSFAQPVDTLANPELGERFIDGVRSAGVTVVPEGQGTTTLDLSFNLTSGSPGKLGPSNSTYKNLSWMSGETLSDRARPSLRGANLSVTIYARDAASLTLTWTGVVTCSVQTDDVKALAGGLGMAVGRALGRSVPDTPL
jgi:hypothetical protein